MSNHNFKIGDKVKLRGQFCGVSGNDIGRVVRIGSYIRVSWSGVLQRKLGEYPHKASEIESAIRVGEQLEFSFM